MNKKRIAKEWLYFLCGMLVGFLVLPLILSFPFGYTMGDFYMEIFGLFLRNHITLPSICAWLVAVSPYLLFQLVRSIIWAYKTSR
jgi:hypothetical protein